MPSWLKFAGLWSLAAIAALTLSWVAVSQVRDRVIQPVTVIPTTIVAVGSDEPDPTIVVVEPSVDDRSRLDRSTSTTLAQDSSSGESSTSSTRAPSESRATTSTAVPQTTTTTPTQTATSAPPKTTTTTSLGTNPPTSSHSTPGGSVTISSAPGQVNFVSAIPQAGFTTELRDTGPERVRVRFVGAKTIFEFEASWDDGELEIETSEHTP